MGLPNGMQMGNGMQFGMNPAAAGGMAAMGLAAGRAAAMNLQQGGFQGGFGR